MVLISALVSGVKKSCRNSNLFTLKQLCQVSTITKPQQKVQSCYNPLRLGTVIVLVSSGIDFVNTPLLYSDRATR